MDCFAEPVIGRRFAPTRWLAMTGKITVVIPGRAKHEPGIHNHDWGLWIPGPRQVARPGMTLMG
jgi:hypothetical protein